MIAVQGLNSVATALSGVAQGLGIFGALGLASLLWGKDLEKVFEQIVGLWPEAGAFLSPEWVANWGENPIDGTMEDIMQPDNDLANTLDPTIDGHSFQGKSATEVYALASAGRIANWEHARNNIINMTYQEYLNMRFSYQRGPIDLTNPKVMAKLQTVGLGPDQWEATAEAEWHRENPHPPQLLTVEQQAQQVNIRITCARKTVIAKTGVAPYANAFKVIWPGMQVGQNPANSEKYIEDNLLDWLSYSSPESTSLGVNVLDASSPAPYNYALRREQALHVIQAYSFWQAPITKP